MTALTLTEAQDGSTVPAQGADTVVVELPESPTTGFRWSVDNGEEALEPTDASFRPAAGGGLGGGGTRVFRYEIPAKRRSHIRLKLWRAWEGERSVTRRFDAWIEP